MSGYEERLICEQFGHVYPVVFEQDKEKRKEHTKITQRCRRCGLVSSHYPEYYDTTIQISEDL